MGLLESFRRRTTISSCATLADFLDSRAAFLVQKCIVEYVRARSGLLSSQLFKEAAFKAAMEHARWRNYPLCLQNCALMVEQALRPVAGAAAPAMREGLILAVADVCRRYPLPAGMAPDFWTGAAKDIARRIRQAGLAGPRPVKDFPLETAEAFFAGLPLHPDLTAFDFQLVTNNVRVNLCRAHENFIAAADPSALVAALVAAAPAEAAAGERG
jgi:hypothetical protein